MCDECYRFCNKWARVQEECDSCGSGVSQCQRFPRESVSQYPSDIECNHVLSQSQFFFFLLRSVCCILLRLESVGFVSICHRFQRTKNMIVTKYLRCSGFFSHSSHPPHRVEKIVDFVTICDRGVDLKPFLSFLDRSFHAFFTAFCS